MKTMETLSSSSNGAESYEDEQSSTGWENMAEQVEQSKEKELSEDEQAAIKMLKSDYEAKKQNQPDISEDDFHKTIVSGLGYYLDVPGYRLGDSDNPDIKPTEEQQARLEELYEMVVGSSEDE